MKFRHVQCALASSLALLWPLTAPAAPDDFRVLGDGLTERGAFDAEFQAAAVKPRGRAGRSSVMQGLAELSYGVADHLAVSLQFPVSRSGGAWRGNGVNLEAQYIAGHDPDAGPYWGARLELARARAPRDSQRTTSIELRPIAGWRVGEWHVVVNAAMRAPLSGGARHAAWESSAKVARRVRGATTLGVEYYVQAAEREGAFASPRQQLALLALDTQLRGVELNVAAGRGLRAGGDGAVLKLVASFGIE